MMNEEAWLNKLGWNAKSLPAWQIDVIVATRPPSDWTVQRNKLSPEDMWLSLTLRSFLPWTAKLKRHDRQFVVDWNDQGASVESEQLRYRKITKWPILRAPADFPYLVAELNGLFPLEFAREAQIRIPHADQPVKVALSNWLSKICDRIEFIIIDE